MFLCSDVQNMFVRIEFGLWSSTLYTKKSFKCGIFVLNRWNAWVIQSIPTKLLPLQSFFHQMNKIKWNFSSQMKTDFPLFTYMFFSVVLQVRLNYPDKLFEKQCKWFIVRAICTWCGNRLSFIFCYQSYFSGNTPFNLDPYIMWQLIRLTQWKYNVARYALKGYLTFSSKKSLHSLCDLSWSNDKIKFQWRFLMWRREYTTLIFLKITQHRQGLLG